MGKLCQECRTACPADAPHCEACGCRFPVKPRLNIRTRLSRLVMIAAVGLLAAFLSELFRHLI